MEFDAAACLRRATSRAKSDVANKLISMFLHEISRRASVEIGMSVSDSKYAKTVVEVFGHRCAYCETALENDRVAVEHLDGMNRLRAGLHLPGNVIVACRTCNSEKRRDDSRKQLVLARTGWQSFVSHDSKGCGPLCNTCSYWKRVWPQPEECAERLAQVAMKISQFRGQFAASVEWMERAQPVLRVRLETLYRDCQFFATDQIKTSVDSFLRELANSKRVQSG